MIVDTHEGRAGAGLNARSYFATASLGLASAATAGEPARTQQVAGDEPAAGVAHVLRSRTERSGRLHGAVLFLPSLVGRPGLSSRWRRDRGTQCWRSVPMRPGRQAPPRPRGRHGGLAAARPVQQGPLGSARPGERAATAPRRGRGVDATGGRRAGRTRRGLDRLLEGAAQLEGPAGRAAVLVDGHRAPRVGRRTAGKRPGRAGPLPVWRCRTGSGQSATSSRPPLSASGSRLRSKTDSGMLIDTALFGMSTTPPSRPSTGAAPRNRYACSKLQPIAGIR
jgi:hypothetical protein